MFFQFLQKVDFVITFSEQFWLEFKIIYTGHIDTNFKEIQSPFRKYEYFELQNFHFPTKGKRVTCPCTCISQLPFRSYFDTHSFLVLWSNRYTNITNQVANLKDLDKGNIITYLPSLKIKQFWRKTNNSQHFAVTE